MRIMNHAPTTLTPEAEGKSEANTLVGVNLHVRQARLIRSGRLQWFERHGDVPLPTPVGDAELTSPRQIAKDAPGKTEVNLAGSRHERGEEVDGVYATSGLAKVATKTMMPVNAAYCSIQ